MDLGTVVGLVLIMALLLGAMAMGVGVGAYIDIPSVLIVVGGSIGALMISFKPGQMKKFTKVFMIAIKPPEENVAELIKKLVEFATKARKDGILAKRGYDKKDAFYGVFVDRVVGLVGLLVLNLLATLIFFGTFDNDFSFLIILITVGGISGFTLLFYLEKITFLKNYKFLNLFHRLSIRLNKLYESRTKLLLHVGISVGVHLLSVLTLYALAWSIDFHLSFQTFLIAVPPVFLLTIIPISLAGWGIREGAMVGIFMLVGADQTKVLAMSILYGLLLIISSLPGSYYWIKSKRTT